MSNFFTRSVFAFLLFIPIYTFGQSYISGDIQINNDFFIRDTSILAANTPQYDNLKTGTEAWLNTNYRNDAWGLSAGVRVDLFYNSNLKYPGTAYSGQGIGAWFIEKKWDDLSLKGGYIYDQIGNGIVFRAFEDRGLGIDKALFGAMAKYTIANKVRLKAFAGKQKDNFSIYKSVLKGANIEADFAKSDKVQYYPGLAVINRTLDKSEMDIIENVINNQSRDTRFVPKYNTYSTSYYHTLNIKNITWIAEAAYHTDETIANSNGLFTHHDGSVFYSSISFPVTQKLGVTLQGKRTENFRLNNNPLEQNNFVSYNFLPAMSRQHSLRLPARYQATTQDLSELAFQGDIDFKLNDKWEFEVNYSHIVSLDNQPYFKELYTEVHYEPNERWMIDFGNQYAEYNIDLYQNKPNAPFVYAMTPFTEISYQINNKYSIRTEVQYQHTKQDFGSWLFGLVELNIAPKWSFALSGMYNMKPKNETDKKKLYHNIFMAYTHKAHRFSIAYVTQVEGINCTGGVCRYEPAFSGVKLGLSSSF